MPQSQCRCEDDFFRQYEDFFLRHLFWNTLNDDSVFEPWVTVQATYRCQGWGLSINRNFSDEDRGSFKVDYPIKELEDIESLRMPWHEIDEAKTAERVQRLSDANANGVSRSQLWGYMAGQEFTAVSPAMHEEFLLRYQLPILKEFGLVAYGCCEDLTNKIAMLRQIPNLRRIAVSPFANVARCADQIGADYVLSYRPSPTDMVSYDFEPDRVRLILRRDLEICKNCFVDITLKDVETVQADSNRVRKWVAVTREIIDEIF
ncbi:MAG: hypothetical protein V1899_00260 [Planctomycetota bacterium]